jgi:hypothetical protein
MKIKSCKVVSVISTVDVKVSHNGKDFTVTVEMEDGKFCEDDVDRGLLTSHGSYHDIDKKTRAKHYEQIRQYVEAHIK